MPSCSLSWARSDVFVELFLIADLLRFSARLVEFLERLVENFAGLVEFNPDRGS